MPNDASPSLKSDSEILSWYGNAAKMRIIQAIVQTPGPKVVFDYGAGNGAGWAETLALHPEITLICYEPSSSVIALRQRVPTAKVVDEPTGIIANFVVSFSVFEHVYDRNAYLRNARAALSSGGTFYLNYDDGHFRKALDLSDIRSWRGQLQEHGRNLLAPAWPKLGLIGHYQHRVSKDETDQQARASGFKIEASRYENLASLKRLAMSIPAADRASFARFWMETEDRLNEAFTLSADEVYGDDVVLWREMASRTLELRAD